MELLQLKYFTEAATCENFSKTAEKFGVPASDVSQSVKRLEVELGCTLFERRANRIILNDTGRRFLDGVSRALSQIEDAIANVRDGGRGEIRILARAIRRLVMQAVENFKRLYPDVEVFVSYDESENPESFDVVVSDGDFYHAGWDRQSLLTEKIVLALNRTNPLSKKEKITPEDLNGEAFISMGKEASLSRTAERILADMGVNPSVSIRSDDPFYVRRCVELSLGVTVVPEISWRGLFDDSVILRSFSDAMRETFVYVNVRRGKRECVGVFTELLSAECKKV